MYLVLQAPQISAYTINNRKLIVKEGILVGGQDQRKKALIPEVQDITLCGSNNNLLGGTYFGMLILQHPILCCNGLVSLVTESCYDA